MFVGTFLERGIFTQLFRLFFCVRLIIRSIRKILELDFFLFFLRPSRKRLGGKRLHTPGESTLSPGEITPGEQDIGRNDLLPSIVSYHEKLHITLNKVFIFYQSTTISRMIQLWHMELHSVQITSVCKARLFEIICSHSQQHFTQVTEYCAFVCVT